MKPLTIINQILSAVRKAQLIQKERKRIAKENAIEQQQIQNFTNQIGETNV